MQIKCCIFAVNPTPLSFSFASIVHCQRNQRPVKDSEVSGHDNSVVVCSDVLKDDVTDPEAVEDDSSVTLIPALALPPTGAGVYV